MGASIARFTELEFEDVRLCGHARCNFHVFRASPNASANSPWRSVWVSCYVRECGCPRTSERYLPSLGVAVGGSPPQPKGGEGFSAVLKPLPGPVHSVDTKTRMERMRLC